VGTAKKHEYQDSETVHYKAKLVVKGYTRKEGINCNEVFSHVVKHFLIKIFLASVAQYNLELDQVDVKTAFLHDDLDEEIHMTQKVRFKTAGQEKLLCKLKKKVYGLKQSSRYSTSDLISLCIETFRDRLDELRVV